MLTTILLITNLATIAVCAFMVHRHRKTLKDLERCRTENSHLLFLTTATFGKYEIEESNGMYSVIYRVPGIDRVASIKFYFTDDPEFNRLQSEELLEKLNE